MNDYRGWDLNQCINRLEQLERENKKLEDEIMSLRSLLYSTKKDKTLQFAIRESLIKKTKKETK